MEHNADRCIYPPIHVHVTLGNEDLTVKVLTSCLYYFEGYFDYCFALGLLIRDHD